jgi:hypothetical protein
MITNLEINNKEYIIELKKCINNYIENKNFEKAFLLFVMNCNKLNYFYRNDLFLYYEKVLLNKIKNNYSDHIL